MGFVMNRDQDAAFGASRQHKIGVARKLNLPKRSDIKFPLEHSLTAEPIVDDNFLGILSPRTEATIM
jgi:hypothetical protein